MKQFKKILCGVMLTSFVILGSVNIFAEGLSGVTDDGGKVPECLQKEERTATTESAKEFTETVTHYGDFGNESFGDDTFWTPDPGTDSTREDTDGDGEPNIEYRVITNYNTDWVTDEYDCDIYIVGNSPISHR